MSSEGIDLYPGVIHMLLDSNIVIYAAQADYAFLRRIIFEDENAAVSAVSLIEIFGYPDLDEEDNRIFQENA